MNRQGVFISYSKKDSKWLDELRTHLNFLERNYKFDIWDDSKIKVGADWREEINKAIGETKIAILMVSANFISSDFIHNEELPALLTLAKDEGALVFSIIVSHCMFTDIEAISKFQSINPPTVPLITMDEGDRDALYVKVTQEIKRVLSIDNEKIETKYKGSKEVSLLNPLKQSFNRVLVMRTLYHSDKKDGLAISEIISISKISSRKELIRIIHNLEKLGILKKEKIHTITYYKLTVYGNKFIANQKNTLF